MPSKVTGQDRFRVLLLWPGGLFGSGKNFGVPQLLAIAAMLQHRADAYVDVVDLDMERALGPVDLSRFAEGRYDLIGLSCYSSYEFLKVMVIGERLRALAPDVCLVVGGYHASACPDDFVAPDSPFDYVVVGDGELVLSSLTEELSAGRRPGDRILGPEPLMDLCSAPPADWSRLERYRPFARRVASQAEIYLSRGCPFGCTFCMERAKREVKWRALEPGQAVEEMHRLDAFLDLSPWTLFVADALFGMRSSWRKEFLSELARRPVRARKVWLLARVDLIDREDMALMARANVSPGFGLESGSPDQLCLLQKASDPERFLAQVEQVASWARELRVPFGANVIVGHPGETEATLRATASFLTRIFSDPDQVYGFVSIDPFRLYPGSAVAQARADWEGKTGMRLHRYPWWYDGDQDFLSEWVDPSSSLDFRQTLRLRWDLFRPIVDGIEARFAYDGPARDYFLRAIREQCGLHKEKRLLRILGLWHLWRGLIEPSPLSEQRAAIRSDADLAAAARVARYDTIKREKIRGSAALLEALELVPRERFVRVEDITLSADDRALPLREDSASTISALHAYAATFGALDLQENDHLVDLGAGTGYGAAVASHVVGPNGRVTAIELDKLLVTLARENLADYPQVSAIHGDAHDLSLWSDATKVAVGFSIRELPPSWINGLAEGGILVAPVGTPRKQTLTRFHKTPDGVKIESLGNVLYVPDRSNAP